MFNTVRVMLCGDLMMMAAGILLGISFVWFYEFLKRKIKTPS